MKQIFLVAVFTFTTIEAKARGQQPSITLDSNHVNVSLETALIFDPKDSNYDVSLIKTLRTFLDSLQHAILSKSNLRMGSKMTTTDEYKLKDFFYDMGQYVLSYKDDKVKRLMVTLQNVVEDYYPIGTVYHKIVFDPRLKAFVKNSLKAWAETDPKVLKSDIKAMYDDPTHYDVFHKLLLALDTLFDKRDADNLKKIAKKFEKLPKTENKLEASLNRALNFIVFERYEKLNFSMKSFMFSELSTVAEYVKTAYKERTLDPEFFSVRRRTLENITLDEFLSPEQDKPEQEKIEHNSILKFNNSIPKVNNSIPKVNNSNFEFSGSEREEVMPVNVTDSLEIITRTSSENEENNELNQEIVLQKNVEINVKKKPEPGIHQFNAIIGNVTTTNMESNGKNYTQNTI